MPLNSHICRKFSSIVFHFTGNKTGVRECWRKKKKVRDMSKYGSKTAFFSIDVLLD